MNIPVEFFILAAAIIGASIGYITAAVFHRVKRHRAELDGYNAARRFYERKHQPGLRRI
jgi:hypothetical protein